MTETKSPIVFYCKDCEKLVDASKFGKRYVYTCKICGTKNVAFGTEKSIKNFFRIPEEKKEEAPVPVSTAAKATSAKSSEKDAPAPTTAPTPEKVPAKAEPATPASDRK